MCFKLLKPNALHELLQLFFGLRVWFWGHPGVPELGVEIFVAGSFREIKGFV